jgi:geranylgeranyl pyrophosphate synthase
MSEHQASAVVEELHDDVLRAQLGPLRGRIDAAMEHLIASWDAPAPLGEAMAYAIRSGGKRIRPAITLSACVAAGGEEAAAMDLGLALELVHTYSLVHDDLPSMDDDALRRGQPTVHIAFGEANAVLTGDALLTEAFRMLADAAALSADARIDAVRVLARAAGHVGMVAGQVRDMAAQFATMDDVRRMQAEKTGALFVAACELGAIAAGAAPAVRGALVQYGHALGAAFQVSDDLLDWMALERGADPHEEAVNLAAQLGEEQARREVARLVAAGLEPLGGLPRDAAFLRTILRWIGERAEATRA